MNEALRNICIYKFEIRLLYVIIIQYIHIIPSHNDI